MLSITSLVALVRSARAKMRRTLSESAAGAHTGKYLLFDRSFYYTDSDMALAAYEDDDSPAKKICTEKELVTKIKNIRSK